MPAKLAKSTPMGERRSPLLALLQYVTLAE